MKKKPLYKDPTQSVETRVADLLRRMTLEEKADQLLQETIGKDANPDNIGPENPFHPTVGSILSFRGGAKARNAYQRTAVEQTRLGIPLIWGFDVVHGWRTPFPASLTQACSFQPALTEKLNAVAAREAYHDGGVNWTFAPMVEVAHDPRWGRVVEGYGEDPHTAGVFTAAAVRGFQGRTAAAMSRPGHVAACLKHFVGYSASEGGRDYSYTDISPRALWEWYLPPFEAGIRAGARTLMSSFNDIGGVPAVANAYTQTEILRTMWGFTGFVVSDWGGVAQLRDQCFSSDPDVQALAALTAGNDMDMVDGVFRRIPDLVRQKRLPVAVLNRAVERVLRVKFELGLFEHPYVPEKDVTETCRQESDLALAVECARESIVLLKNEKNTLPLNPQKIRSIALVGPMAKDGYAHIGSWPAMCDHDGTYAPTLFDEVQKAFPKAVVTCVQGCDYEDPSQEGFAEALAAAKGADVVLLALGESGWMTGENKSRVDISLPGQQSALVAALRESTSAPLIGLVAAGRPLAFPETAEHMDALLFLGQSGYGASQATVEILTGKVTPSGHLSMTFPRAVGQIPLYYNHHERSRKGSQDYTVGFPHNGPWFPFGFGLSYTEFSYGKIRVTKRKGTFVASVTVTNTGRVAGKETVFWYLTDVEATYTQPLRRVVAFEKIHLAPGESKTVRVSLNPMRDLAYPDGDGNRILEAGEFRLSASGKVEESFLFAVD